MKKASYPSPEPGTTTSKPFFNSSTQQININYQFNTGSMQYEHSISMHTRYRYLVYRNRGIIDVQRQHRLPVHHSELVRACSFGYRGVLQLTVRTPRRWPKTTRRRARNHGVDWHYHVPGIRREHQYFGVTPA